MAASALQLEPVAEVIAKLHALLAKARSLKRETTIDPPLPTVDLTRDVEAIHDGHSDDAAYDQAYRWATFDTAAREIFYALIISSDIESKDFVEVWNFIDILIFCGDAGICEPQLPCYILEELLDSQTIHGCRVVFDYLESSRDRLAQKDFHKKQLTFLRVGNELLRRLSRAEDAIFCGRVFFFLFQIFPLGDKSSVNMRGDFHTENVTKFENKLSDSKQDGDHMDIDPAPLRTETETPKVETPAQTPQPPTRPGSKAVPIKAPSKEQPKTVEEKVLDSSELYPIFWRLQQYFSEPTRLFTASDFLEFRRGLAATITKFKETPTVAQTQTTERGTKRKLGADGLTNGHADDTLADTYNPKYLTSRDLFDLELSDLAFQRHILVQALILIDFLLSLTDKAKKKLVTLPTPNKSLLYSFTLTEEDTKWALTTRSNIREKLKETVDGKFYERMVETVLARDRNWVRWKVESCPSIVRDPVPTALELEARAGAKAATRPRRVPEKPMGAMDLSFLDETAQNAADGLEALKDPTRYTAPSIQDLVNGIKADELDAEMTIDEAEKASFENAMSNKRWRALRQARASRLSLLDRVEPGKSLEDVFRKRDRGEPVENGDHVVGECMESDAPAVVVSQEPEPELMSIEQRTEEPLAVT